MTLQGLNDYFNRIHWPQVFVLSIFTVCIFGAPILFFSLIKADTLALLIGLPWMTILGPGLMAVMAALTAIKGFFSHSIIKTKGEAATAIIVRAADPTPMVIQNPPTLVVGTPQVVVPDPTLIERDATHEEA